VNQFWVDPEGLGRSGSGYAEVQAELLGLKQGVENLMASYADSFGNDSSGVQFKQNFDEGIGQYRDGVGALADQLGFISEGLATNGKTYANSRDSADLASYQFLTNGEKAGFGQEQPTGPSTLSRNEVEPKKEPARDEARNATHRLEPVREFERPKMTRVEPVREFERPKMTRVEPQRRQGVMDKAGNNQTAMGDGEDSLPQQVTKPISPSGYGLDDVDRQKVEVRPPELFSAISMLAPRTDAPPVVDGRPLGEGQRVVFGHALPDGSVRLDVDTYSHITPLGNSEVSMGDQPYPAKDGDRAFLVTEKPGVGQTLPPPSDRLYMEFPPEGGGGPTLYRMSSSDRG
jgi:hypothetical protein